MILADWHPVPISMDVNTVVGILGIVSVVLAPIITSMVMRRDHYTKQIEDMSDAETKLQSRIDALDGKVGRLFDTNYELEKQLREYRRRDLEQVDYIRRVGHWMSEACEAMHVDRAWADMHPKPHLPESIRQELPPERRHIDTKEDKK